MDGRTVGDIVGDEGVAEAETEVVLDGEVQFVPPEASTDGEAMQVVVPIDAGADGWLIMPDLADHMRDVIEADGNGMTTFLTGYAGFAADQAEAFESIDGVSCWPPSASSSSSCCSPIAARSCGSSRLSACSSPFSAHRASSIYS
jgi:hypothetical protein